MAFGKVATVILLTLAAGDQCRISQGIYSNCWGDDLRGERADSFETCCQRCAEIRECEAFTFDVWNVSGDAEPYCFFKYGCSEPTHSDTAISGILQRPSTEKTTNAPKTTHAPTTTTTTTPPFTSEVPSSSTTTTTTTDARQPQCTAPSPVAGVGLADVENQFNVSSWKDCCGTCAAPACSYVTFGKYSNASQETWACFHVAQPANVSLASRLYGSGEFLMLHDTIEAAVCKDLGLEGCAASPVSMGPGPLPGPSATISPAALVALGAVAFLVAIPFGYFLARHRKCIIDLTVALAYALRGCCI